MVDPAVKIEKRQANRVVFSVTVHYKIFYLERLEKDVRDLTLGLKAKIPDVSLSGLQVVSPVAFRQGDILEIELEIHGGALVRSISKIVWCKKNSKSGDFRSKIRLIPVYEHDLKKLEDYLKGRV